MELEDHFPDRTGRHWHNYYIVVIVFRLRNRQTQYIHLFRHIFLLLARKTSQTSHCLTTKQVVNDCWLFFQLLGYFIQKHIHELLSVMLVKSTKQRHIFVNCPLERMCQRFLIGKQSFSQVAELKSHGLLLFLKRELS